MGTGRALKNAHLQGKPSQVVPNHQEGFHLITIVCTRRLEVSVKRCG